MKIVGVCGSPREGNTETMLKAVLDSARDKGAETELILLREKKISFCDGDQSCSDTQSCVVSDDMNKIVDTINSSDIVVFGSPCYFNNVSGHFKVFIDRTNSLYESKVWKGKKTFVLMVGGFESSVKKGVKTLLDFCEIHGMKLLGSYIAVGEEKDEIKNNNKVLNDLKEIGERLANE